MLRKKPLRLFEADNGSNPAGGTSQADASTTNPTLQASDPNLPTTSQADESHNKSTKSADDYERMIAELRKENAGHRTRLKKVEEEETKRAEAQLTKEQLLEKQYNDLKAQHEEYTQAQTERTIKHEVALEAAKLGVNPKHLDRVARFIDWEEIEVDEQGHPTNVREVVEQLVKDMPELIPKSAPTSGGATNPPRSQSTAPAQLSWDLIGKMKPEEYNARRAEIQSWIAANPHRYGSRLK
jgi:flagellar biosynthesis GTPase FlhF